MLFNRRNNEIGHGPALVHEVTPVSKLPITTALDSSREREIYIPLTLGFIDRRDLTARNSHPDKETTLGNGIILAEACTSEVFGHVSFPAVLTHHGNRAAKPEE